METQFDQFEELKRFFPSVKRASEGGGEVYLIEQLALPEGCTPSPIDVLLVPFPVNGYKPRLFYSERVSCPNKNWNTLVRLLDKNWHSYSWNCPDGLTLLELMQYHLHVLKNKSV